MINNKYIYLKFKRIFDLIFAILSLFLLSPLLIIISILSLIFLGAPILFIQKRPGFKDKIFKIYKFRTMNNNLDNNGKLLDDDKRLTRFGLFLRKTSLDELPSLINVIKGDMSFIGPRPLLVEYLTRYSEKQKERHNVKPGITGLAQINGRNLLTWDEKLEYDVLYTYKFSFLLDIRILIKTFFIVLKRKGISSKGSSTMSVFKGSNNPNNNF